MGGVSGAMADSMTDSMDITPEFYGVNELSTKVQVMSFF